MKTFAWFIIATAFGAAILMGAVAAVITYFRLPLRNSTKDLKHEED